MGTMIVNVRSFHERGFCRGGYRWPVAGRTVEVTEALYGVLKAEKLISVDDRPSAEMLAAKEDGVLDYVDNACVDMKASAARQEVAALKAETEALAAELEVKRLKEKKEALMKELAEQPKAPKAK